MVDVSKKLEYACENFISESLGLDEKVEEQVRPLMLNEYKGWSHSMVNVVLPTYINANLIFDRTCISVNRDIIRALKQESYTNDEIFDLILTEFDIVGKGLIYKTDNLDYKDRLENLVFLREEYSDLDFAVRLFAINMSYIITTGQYLYTR